MRIVLLIVALAGAVSGCTPSRPDAGAATPTTTTVAPLVRVHPQPYRADRMPDAGTEPADPDRARDAIERAYSYAWDNWMGDGVRRAAIHRGAGLLRAWREVDARYPAATRTITVSVDDVAFTGPRSAAVRFELDYDGAPTFGPQIGEAYLVDRRWKVGRETVCMVIRWAGVGC